jgi:hypothetical protein
MSIILFHNFLFLLCAFLCHKVAAPLLHGPTTFCEEGSAMSRKSLMLGIALFGLLFASWGIAQTPADTNVFDQIQNSKDIEGVRMVILREIEGFLKADPEQVFSCYDADNFIGYDLNGNPDPKTWVIAGFGREDIRKYADQAKTIPEFLKKYPGITQNAEIQHVQVKGNNAIAVARQIWVTPDKGKGETNTHEYESAFLLKKNAQGIWKITGFLGGATSKKEVTDLVE